MVMRAARWGVVVERARVRRVLVGRTGAWVRGESGRVGRREVRKDIFCWYLWVVRVWDMVGDVGWLVIWQTLGVVVVRGFAGVWWFLCGFS